MTFSVIHDQGFENVCWAFSISTMLRASIRSAVIKYKIKNGLEILNNPNHHKMMRKELTMNIFPFGDDGADPSMVIKLVRLADFIWKNLFNYELNYVIFLVNNTDRLAWAWFTPSTHSDFDFWKFRIRSAAFR